MSDNWSISETDFQPEKLSQNETVYAIGNGYMGTRGTFEEGFPGEDAATLIHGVFDDIPIVHTELVNSPNWIHLELLVNGEPFCLDRGRVLSYRRVLDLHNGVLTRQIRWRSPAGDTVDLELERFASLAEEHLLAIRCQVTALDFSGRLELRSGLPGHVDNDGWMHWNWIEQGFSEPSSAYLMLETRKTHISLCEAFAFEVSGGKLIEQDYWDSRWSPTLVASVAVEQGQTIRAQKLVTIYTSRDTDDLVGAAHGLLERAREAGYAVLHEQNDDAWQKEWQQSNITIEGDDLADRSLRYSLFQLLIAAPRHDTRVSIPAKALSGFGYRGHVFWDTEIFALPFFIYTQPQIARNLLLYRYHTLAGARQKARENGFEGAMYAWESAASGDETTPRWVPSAHSKELTRIWCGDIEHHISADVAYAVMQYWRVSGDDDFMRNYGAEIVLETARFWCSRAEWNETTSRYELTNVIGPDEYHDRVDNNVYTNHLARWNLRAAFQVLDWLRTCDPEKARELEMSLNITSERLNTWREVSERMALGFDVSTKLFEQFDGYFDLKFVDLKTYEPRSISMQALLGIEGVQDYQFIKQPDVLMMLYLLEQEFEPEVLKANWGYYTARTDLSYGSSLGPAIQSLVTTRIGKIEQAYQHFMHAASTDLEDARGNTADGFHAATAGGLWQAVVFGFSGLRIANSIPAVTPQLPEGWRRLKFNIQYRGRNYEFDLRPGENGPLQSDKPGVQSPKMPVLGAIFDLDGVLTDTSELHYLAWKRLADEEGIPFDRRKNEALRGVSRRESLELLLDGRSYPEAQLQEMMERKNGYYLQSISHLTPQDLLPGCLDFLKELHTAGIKVAIGSASRNAQQVIESLGLASWVDKIADGNAVERQKPAPDLFLHASKMLDLPAEQCVVFEDAEAGIEAALAGNMWVVGIGLQERVGRAHLVLKGFQNVTWESIRQGLNRSEN